MTNYSCIESLMSFYCKITLRCLYNLAWRGVPFKILFLYFCFCELKCIASSHKWEGGVIIIVIYSVNSTTGNNLGNRFLCPSMKANTSLGNDMHRSLIQFIHASQLQNFQRTRACEWMGKWRWQLFSLYSWYKVLLERQPFFFPV